MNKEKKSRKKTRTDAICYWNYVGHAAEKVLRKWPTPEPVNDCELCAITVIAIVPEILAASVANAKAAELARVFADCYSKNPDLTLELLRAMRKKWNKQSSIAQRVQRYLATQTWCRFKENGKPAIISTRKMTDGELTATVFNRKSQKTSSYVVSVTQSRKRMEFPSKTLVITRKLKDALDELRHWGFNVGDGT